MKYNTVLIGDRIRAERKKRKWSQEDLIEKLAQTKMQVRIGRNSISKIESSSKHDFSCFGLDLLIALSELYDCEIGYLLGEYDCPTGRNTDIKEETGLSNEAINTLLFLKEHSSDFTDRFSKLSPIDILNFIMSDHLAFSYFLDHLGDYFDSKYDTPLHYDSSTGIYMESKSEAPIQYLSDESINKEEKEFVIGYKSQDGKYFHRHIPISCIEQYDMEQIKNWINVWRDNYKRSSERRQRNEKS